MSRKRTKSFIVSLPLYRKSLGMPLSNSVESLISEDSCPSNRTSKNKRGRPRKSQTETYFYEESGRRLSKQEDYDNCEESFLLNKKTRKEKPYTKTETPSILYIKWIKKRIDLHEYGSTLTENEREHFSHELDQIYKNADHVYKRHIRILQRKLRSFSTISKRMSKRQESYISHALSDLYMELEDIVCNISGSNLDIVATDENVQSPDLFSSADNSPNKAIEFGMEENSVTTTTVQKNVEANSSVPSNTASEKLIYAEGLPKFPNIDEDIKRLERLSKVDLSENTEVISEIDSVSQIDCNLLTNPNFISSEELRKTLNEIIGIESTRNLKQQENISERLKNDIIDESFNKNNNNVQILQKHKVNTKYSNKNDKHTAKSKHVDECNVPVTKRKVSNSKINENMKINLSDKPFTQTVCISKSESPDIIENTECFTQNIRMNTIDKTNQNLFDEFDTTEKIQDTNIVEEEINTSGRIEGKIFNKQDCNKNKGFLKQISEIQDFQEVSNSIYEKSYDKVKNELKGFQNQNLDKLEQLYKSYYKKYFKTKNEITKRSSEEPRVGFSKKVKHITLDFDKNIIPKEKFANPERRLHNGQEDARYCNPDKIINIVSSVNVGDAMLNKDNNKNHANIKEDEMNPFPPKTTVDESGKIEIIDINSTRNITRDNDNKKLLLCSQHFSTESLRTQSDIFNSKDETDSLDIFTNIVKENNIIKEITTENVNTLNRSIENVNALDRMENLKALNRIIENVTECMKTQSDKFNSIDESLDISTNIVKKNNKIEKQLHQEVTTENVNTLNRSIENGNTLNSTTENVNALNRTTKNVNALNRIIENGTESMRALTDIFKSKDEIDRLNIITNSVKENDRIKKKLHLEGPTENVSTLNRTKKNANLNKAIENVKALNKTTENVNILYITKENTIALNNTTENGNSLNKTSDNLNKTTENANTLNNTTENANLNCLNRTTETLSTTKCNDNFPKRKKVFKMLDLIVKPKRISDMYFNTTIPKSNTSLNVSKKEINEYSNVDEMQTLNSSPNLSYMNDENFSFDNLFKTDSDNCNNCNQYLERLKVSDIQEISREQHGNLKIIDLIAKSKSSNIYLITTNKKIDLRNNSKINITQVNVNSLKNKYDLLAAKMWPKVSESIVNDFFFIKEETDNISESSGNTTMMSLNVSPRGSPNNQHAMSEADSIDFLNPPEKNREIIVMEENDRLNLTKTLDENIGRFEIENTLNDSSFSHILGDFCKLVVNCGVNLTISLNEMKSVAECKKKVGINMLRKEGCISTEKVDEFHRMDLCLGQQINMYRYQEEKNQPQDWEKLFPSK